MKSNKGITMIQMVVTVLMMALIAGFSIFNARDTIVEIKLSKVYEEMREVKKAVQSLNIFEENLSLHFDATPLENLNSYHQLTEYQTTPNEYYYLDFSNKERAKFLEEVLDIRNIENDYIVNTANMENIEIFLVNGIEIEKTRYYTESEILEKYNDIFTGR